MAEQRRPEEEPRDPLEQDPDRLDDTADDVEANDEGRHLGDVLGLSDAPPDVEIPRATQDRGGHPKGIELGRERRATGELPRIGGPTGASMGAGGSGTDIEPDQSRPAAVRPESQED